MNRQNGEQRIERQRTTIVVADEQRGPRGRHVFDPAKLQAEVVTRQRTGQVGEDRHELGIVGIQIVAGRQLGRGQAIARRAKGCSGCRAGSKATDHDHRSRRSRADTTAAGGRAGIGLGIAVGVHCALSWG